MPIHMVGIGKGEHRNTDLFLGKLSKMFSQLFTQPFSSLLTQTFSDLQPYDDLFCKVNLIIFLFFLYSQTHHLIIISFPFT